MIFRNRNMRSKMGYWTWLALVFWASSLYVMYFYASSQSVTENNSPPLYLNREIKMAPPVEYQMERKVTTYDTQMPLIFIGGVPRSGTTLMRTMLDAHPDVRCGQETRVIPRMLGMRANWLKSPKESIRLEEAGITAQVLDSAVAEFILEVIVKHGHSAPRLCNKDPFTLKSLKYLKQLFPNSKFILMLRDGRATAHSIVSRQVTITGFDITSYRDVLAKWSRAIEVMYVQCREVGPLVCLPVQYEQLVLQPLREMRRILDFLDIPWNPSVLNHEKHISNISLSKVEKSTDQVQRPLYLDALTSWFGHLPPDVARDLPHIAPMLQQLGYDPYNPRPKYGVPDEWVLNKTREAMQSS